MKRRGISILAVLSVILCLVAIFALRDSGDANRARTEHGSSGRVDEHQVTSRDPNAESDDADGKPLRLVRVELLVIDEHGRPRPNADIHNADLFLPDCWGGYRGLLNHTDNEGRRVLTRQPNEPIRLIAVYGDYGSDVVTVQAASNQSAQEFTLQIRTDIQLYSRVRVLVSNEDGAPVPGVQAEWREPRWTPSEARLDRYGIAAFPVPAYDFALAGIFHGGNIFSFSTDANGIAELNVPVPSGRAVEIRTQMRSDSPFLPAIADATFGATTGIANGITAKVVLRRGVYRTIVPRNEKGEDVTRRVGLRRSTKVLASGSCLIQTHATSCRPREWTTCWTRIGHHPRRMSRRSSSSVNPSSSLAARCPCVVKSSIGRAPRWWE